VDEESLRVFPNRSTSITSTIGVDSAVAGLGIEYGPPPVMDEAEYPPASLQNISETNISSDGLADRLIRAVQEQDVDEVKRLLSEGAPINAVDRDKQNLLDIACYTARNGVQVSLVGVLIARGLKKLNFDDDDSCAVLMDCKRELKLKKDFKRKDELKRRKK